MHCITYYRLGLDRFYENEAEAREGVANCLNFLNTVNTENPNSMIMQFFFQGKSNELVKSFQQGRQRYQDPDPGIFDETGYYKYHRV